MAEGGVDHNRLLTEIRQGNQLLHERISKLADETRGGIGQLNTELAVVATKVEAHGKMSAGNDKEIAAIKLKLATLEGQKSVWAALLKHPLVAWLVAGMVALYAALGSHPPGGSH